MFAPGTLIHEFTSKKDHAITFRLIERDDAVGMTSYINDLSCEDTYIRLGGEQFSFEEEQRHIETWLSQMEKQEKVVVVAVFEERIIGVANVDRLDRRSKHVGHFGISIAKDFRQEGIGKELLKTVLDLGTRMGLMMIELSVYSPNEVGIALYQKLGFEEVGRVPKKILFHDQLVDEIIMVKFL